MRKSRNSPLYSSSTSSTPSTLAAGGPRRAHPARALTAPSSPSRTASTRPSGRFLTHPLTPRRSASSFIVDLKKTPCTLPEIHRWSLSWRPPGMPGGIGGGAINREGPPPHGPLNAPMGHVQKQSALAHAVGRPGPFRGAGSPSPPSEGEQGGQRVRQGGEDR
jgi:hypothetical protein